MNIQLVKEAINPAIVPLIEIDKGEGFLVGGSLFVRNGSFSCRDKSLICCNDVLGDNRIQLPNTTQVTKVKITLMLEEVEA